MPVVTSWLMENLNRSATCILVFRFGGKSRHAYDVFHHRARRGGE